MARITIEDCTERVGNRFALVLMVSVRTKQLMRGAKALVKTGENKSVVNALREVAAGHVSSDIEDVEH
ncbi:MAG TPA: DNA-directed RNA polymerase subunit omega [Myxococcota bacterium]|nr:DNA-directed RNA polymerase subunit omega [Myxococcota bacterium]